jgi:hypothetical protein
MTSFHDDRGDYPWRLGGLRLEEDPSLSKGKKVVRRFLRFLSKQRGEGKETAGSFLYQVLVSGENP